MMHILERAKVHIFLVALVFLLIGGRAHAQFDPVFDRMIEEITILEEHGDYKTAIPLAEKLLGLMKQQAGPNKLTIPIFLSMDRLARLYHEDKRYAEAELLYKQLMPDYELAFGVNHLIFADKLASLANLYREQQKFKESEPLYLRALKIREASLPRDHPDVTKTLLHLALIYHHQGRNQEVIGYCQRLLSIFSGNGSADDPVFEETYSLLGLTYRMLGRLSEAETIGARWISILEAYPKRQNSKLTTAMSNLGGIYAEQGRFDLAEEKYKQALHVAESKTPVDRYLSASIMNNMANLFYMQGRKAEAEAILLKVLSVFRNEGNKNPRSISAVLNSLGSLCQSEKRFVEAQLYYTQAIDSLNTLKDLNDIELLKPENNLASLYTDVGRYTEAESIFKHQLNVAKRVLGDDHPVVGDIENNLGVLFYRAGKPDEAERFLTASLAIVEKRLPVDHPSASGTLDNLSSIYARKGDWARAIETSRRSVKTTIMEMRRNRYHPTGSIGEDFSAQADRFGLRFVGLIKAADRLSAAGGADRLTLAMETFETVQWLENSSASIAFSEMAVRGATGNAQLASLVRTQQDLALKWQQLENSRVTALSRDYQQSSEDNSDRNLKTVEDALQKVAAEINSRFPDFSELSNPSSVSAKDVQSYLNHDEALLVSIVVPPLEHTPGETYVWALTRTEMRWVRVNLDFREIVEMVQALRCGLDGTAWDDAGQNCSRLLTAKPERNAAGEIETATLPFDHERANRLYKALFGQVEDLVKGKQLVIVPSGPLSQLPFQVLVTAPPSAAGDNKAAAWLIRDHALTVLPAVSSLKALRRVARPSAATNPMIGFGNPLLDGDKSDSKDVVRAEYARRCQNCDSPAVQRIASMLGLRRHVTLVEMRGADATAAHVRKQMPLPETATELCYVARDMNADTADIHLGKGANEHEIKELSKQGKLAQYRIVHFATHGVLAGKLKGSSEPGLILTPPSVATEDDDGYLSASEIAGLKLDADWVILSACNTAAGDTTGAQALSGLARAFIYAQARALLVSHWAVDSAATVKLITGAMRETSRDAKVGRAEALRRSMLALIDKGEPKEAHPAFWAPFIVVGEGAR